MVSFLPISGGFWLLVLATVILTFVVHYIASCVQLLRRSTDQVAQFNGPTSHWLKGNVDDVQFTGKGLKFYLECTAKYKKAFRVWFGPLRSALVLVHPDTVKVILSSNAPKERFVYNLLMPFIGNGLVVQEEPRHSVTRKLLTPAFHYEILKTHFNVFQDSTNVLLDKWSKCDGEVELFSDISLLTLDSVLKCAMSYDSNCQLQKLTSSKRDPYVKAIYDISKAIVERLVNPLVHPDWLYFVTPQGVKFHRDCATVHNKAKLVLEERKKASGQMEQEEEKKRKRLDFLDILLLARDEKCNPLTDEQIRVEMDTFTFAGHDTTASAISWALYNLARFPEHQRKCQEEVDRILKNKEELEWEDTNKLMYLTQCLKESMRLFTPVPMISRTLDKSYEIDGKQAPEGTWVMTNIFCLHRNPLVWENPETLLIPMAKHSSWISVALCLLDKYKFDPSRFTPENVEKRAPHAFVPFSSGPRNCIGQNFAYTEVKVVLAKVIHRFDLSVKPRYVVDQDDLFPELILRTKSGIRINLKPRQTAV